MCKQQMARRLVPLLIILLLPTVPGCITRPPPMALHEELSNQPIALVPDRSEVVIATDLFARSKPMGALKGAGHGIAELLEKLGTGSCSGELCGPALVLYATFSVVVGGTIGAVQGAVEAASAQTATGIDNLIDRHLKRLASHVDLTQRILAHRHQAAGLSIDLVPLAGRAKGVSAADIRKLRAQGYRKILTVRFTRFDFTGDKGNDPNLGIFIEVQARIIDTEREKDVYEREFSASGEARRYSEWLKMDPNAFSRELESHLDQLADDIVNGLFLSQRLPVSSGSWVFPGAKNYGCCWICPVSPPLVLNYLPTMTQGWPRVSSRQPQLEWEPFPGEQRQAQLLGQVGVQATDIHYDLRVWEDSGNKRGTLVYERYGLPATFHRLEELLEPATRYLWSMRACFNLGPRAACSPWAFSLVPAGPDACETTTVKAANCYRFETP